MSYIAAADGVRLFYQDWGTGKPLVLIHGWPLSSESWEYQMTALPDMGLRCIAYDRRGFGKSSKPWAGYDYDVMADDLKAVMDQLGLEDVTLAGFSMGGGEVVRYFSRHGGARVSKAVLISSVAPYMLRTRDNPDGVDKSTLDQMVSDILKDRPAFLSSFGKQFYGVGLLGSSVSSELLKWTSMLALQASPRATIDCIRAFSQTDFRNEMERITVPTLVIHGDDDKTVPIDATGREAARRVPGAELKVYDGAPHGLFYTHADQLNEDLANFVHQSAPLPDESEYAMAT